MTDKKKKSINDFMVKEVIVVKDTNAIKGGESGRSIDISYYAA